MRRRATSSDCKAEYGKRGLVAESGPGQRDHSCLDHLLVGLLSGSLSDQTGQNVQKSAYVFSPLAHTTSLDHQHI